MTSPAFSSTQTVTILRPGVPDRAGDPTSGDPDRDVAGCVVWPTGSTEQTGLQDTTTDSLSILMPSGTDVKVTDRLRYQGDLYDVTGTPQRFVSPFTNLDPGILVVARRTTG